ncbi:sporulation-specific diadenylate cyclase CdaS [Falsibacillus albus]|uniref:Diadenylate cyclase n=1 Tax=Falsibacillus albus TaxID=2478915 RepID=A0A3L7K1P2_9BACI|nr:sporulation-specific diadenylate cyclase CdaS [Falsibacillus albus]RLQ96309.1 hypothetical protein D9X91_08475 [Falsibacillus albus]
MQESNCDFSPMKKKISESLVEIKQELQLSEAVLEDENYCLLGKLESIREKFMEVESMAASFYLNCYLSSYSNIYSELSVCVQHLSERRHGALIVIERETNVVPFIQKGTQIDAQCTPPLLEAIFYPGNPLHDGAVLIRSDHIISASNVLPLSHKIIENEKLGTRHRAAMGLSEITDALVMVVSEETGKVSFALDGKLFPIATGI